MLFGSYENTPMTVAGVGTGMPTRWLYSEYGRFLNVYGIRSGINITFNLSSAEDIKAKLDKLVVMKNDGIINADDLNELEERLRTSSNFVVGGNGNQTGAAISEGFKKSKQLDSKLISFCDKFESSWESKGDRLKWSDIYKDYKKFFGEDISDSDEDKQDYINTYISIRLDDLGIDSEDINETISEGLEKVCLDISKSYGIEPHVSKFSSGEVLTIFVDDIKDKSIENKLISKYGFKRKSFASGDRLILNESVDEAAMGKVEKEIYDDLYKYAKEWRYTTRWKKENVFDNKVARLYKMYGENRVKPVIAKLNKDFVKKEKVKSEPYTAEMIGEGAEHLQSPEVLEKRRKALDERKTDKALGILDESKKKRKRKVIASV